MTVTARTLNASYVFKAAIDAAYKHGDTPDAKFWQEVAIEKLATMADHLGYTIRKKSPELTALADAGIMPVSEYIRHVSEDDREPHGQVLR